jgi:hypothetical protein
VILQDVRTEHGPYAIRAQNYRVSMVEFIVPNNFHYISGQVTYPSIQGIHPSVDRFEFIDAASMHHVS